MKPEQKEPSAIHDSPIHQPPTVVNLNSSPYQSDSSDDYELIAEYYGPLYQHSPKLAEPPISSWAEQAHRDLDQYIRPN